MSPANITVKATLSAMVSAGKRTASRAAEAALGIDGILVLFAEVSSVGGDKSPAGDLRLSKTSLTPIIGATLLCVALSACGYFDAQSTFAPEILRAKAPHAERPDDPPDAVLFVKEHQSEIFYGEASGVKVGRPRLVGLHWQFCVFAFVKGVTGSTNEALLVVETKNGLMESRRRARDQDNCDFN